MLNVFLNLEHVLPPKVEYFVRLHQIIRQIIRQLRGNPVSKPRALPSGETKEATGSRDFSRGLPPFFCLVFPPLFSFRSDTIGTCNRWYRRQMRFFDQ